MVANLEKLYEQYRDSKLSHAFVLQTNDKNKCLLELKNLLKMMACEGKYSSGCSKCEICRQIDNDEYLSVHIVYPDGKSIKKEQIAELKRKMAFKPIFSRFNAYIIMEAEKLNSSSTNTMLKFLEEPEPDIYGFLIVDSKENLLPTIQSRCQTETVYFDGGNILTRLNLDSELEEKYLQIAEKYLKLLTIENEDLILYNKDVIFSNFTTREELEILFKIMNEAYNEALEIKSKIKSGFSFGSFEVLLKDSLPTLVKKAKLITNFLNNINYNLNLELMLDRFVIEMGEIHE